MTSGKQAPRPAKPSGESIGGYKLLAELNKGFFGPLWAGFDPDQKLAPATVIIRRVHAPKARLGGLVEAAQWAQGLDDPRVTPVIATAQKGDDLDVVMPHVDGESLRGLLRAAQFQRKPIPPEITRRIAAELLAQLEALHSQSASAPAGCAFGGLQPDSILVGTDGGTRLIDVGVSAVASAMDPWRHEAQRSAYLAPEQLPRGAKLDPRADVFALGTLLWEMFANRRLFPGATDAAIRDKIKKSEAPRLDKVRLSGAPSVPKEVADVLERALRRDPDGRFADTRSMYEAVVASGELATEKDVGAWVRAAAHHALDKRHRTFERSQAATDSLDPRGRDAVPGVLEVMKSRLAEASAPDETESESQPPPRSVRPPPPPRSVRPPPPAEQRGKEDSVVDLSDNIDEETEPQSEESPRSEESASAEARSTEVTEPRSGEEDAGASESAPAEQPPQAQEPSDVTAVEPAASTEVEPAASTEAEQSAEPDEASSPSTSAGEAEEARPGSTPPPSPLKAKAPPKPKRDRRKPAPAVLPPPLPEDEAAAAHAQLDALSQIAAATQRDSMLAALAKPRQGPSKRLIAGGAVALIALIAVAAIAIRGADDEPAEDTTQVEPAQAPAKQVAETTPAPSRKEKETEPTEESETAPAADRDAGRETKPREEASADKSDTNQKTTSADRDDETEKEASSTHETQASPPRAPGPKPAVEQGAPPARKHYPRRGSGSPDESYKPGGI